MDLFTNSERSHRYQRQLLAFMDECVYPAEPVYARQMLDSNDPHHHPQILEDLKAEARARGLWNLFHPHPEWGPGLTNLEYAPLAEIMGRSPHLAPEACNCNAPDTGNMEVLTLFGTEEHKQRWLEPLLAGTIRSAFAMTEPDVASSDATNIELRIDRDGDHYVLNGRKWFATNALHTNCKVLIVMGKTDPHPPKHRQQSMMIVPIDAPGVTVRRNLPFFGYTDREGHAEIDFVDVRVPVSDVLKGEGEGFAIGQARLGPGRIHHCMRAIGMAERALELMCVRAETRITFGQKLSERANIQDWIAEARIAIEQTRLLTLKAAWMMDTVGNKAAQTEIAAIKVAAPAMALQIVDRAIQVHGAAGVSDDFPLARLYADLRTLRIADGPDEVHKRAIARAELGKVHATANPPTPPRRSSARPQVRRPSNWTTPPSPLGSPRSKSIVLSPFTPSESESGSRI
ncbi:acyl-CoA dehydrogenase family protein [Nocardia transvalensis]|uniref:acyl-CoA dehydrogenase family protein n=1 Tax=Nocardia transvalensis TaxID=37333 RepID=UPI001E4B3AB7|nr:acyl-CoA dehydrogenase family protein [Nocardia transvalensis]